MTIKGNRKCKEKKRVKVEPPTANPPQIQRTKNFPTKGTADNNLVITVAPQYDIWPQGNTYPKKAVNIDNININVPKNQTRNCFQEE